MKQHQFYLILAYMNFILAVICLHANYNASFIVTMALSIIYALRSFYHALKEV